MGQTPRRKTDRDHTINIAPNLLDRGFTADRPNQKRAGDISQIWTREGWLYLAVILDLHSRRGIGWATSDRRKRDLAIRALRIVIALPSSPCRHRSAVIALGSPLWGCIFHSNCGSQYPSHDDHKILREHGLLSSKRQGQLP